MTSIPPLGREAIEHARRGDFDRALAVANKGVEAHPDDLGLRMFLGMLHARRMELREALPHLRAAVSINPADPMARFELVRVLIGVGQVDEAETVLNEVQLPGPEPLRLRAMVLQRRNNSAGAAQLYRQLVGVDPRDFESWGNLGLCLLAADRPREAIAAFDRSLALRPDRLSIRLKWAEAHLAAGTAKQALSEAGELASRNPTEATSCITVAHLEDLLGRPEQALAALEEAVRRDETSDGALVAMAELLERQNNLDELQVILARLAALPGPVDKLPLLQARLEYRRGNYKKALELARGAPAAVDAGTRAQLIGQILDKLGEARKAYACFVDMNQEDSRAGARIEGKPELYRELIAQQRRLLSAEWVAGWRHVPPPLEREPAFLVGFPRSGTTLLDTLLIGHPDVCVAEEKPMLMSVGEKIGELARLAELGAEEVGELRQLYFDVAEQHLGAHPGERLLIDKYPFGMGAAPIIHRLFPTARIIFMERHPCDVVLSCFITRFQPTQAATNFFALRDTALLYDELMQLWTKSLELFPLTVHRVRYERLVDHIEPELRPLAAFLGLEWTPQLMEHRATARKRGFINTPSYAQVTEAVDAKSVARWERYREQLEEVLPILEPWAQLMGYKL